MKYLIALLLIISTELMKKSYAQEMTIDENEVFTSTGIEKSSALAKLEAQSGSQSGLTIIKAPYSDLLLEGFDFGTLIETVDPNDFDANHKFKVTNTTDNLGNPQMGSYR